MRDENDIETDIDNLVNNFEFKPITEGLGFHHSLKDEKEIRTDLNKQSKLLKSEFETRTQNLKNATPTTMAAANMGDLSPFYDSPKAIETKTLVTEIFEEKEEETLPNITNSSLNTRLFAWTIDFLVLTTVITLTFASIFFFAELPLEILSALMVTSEIPESFLTIFLLFYAFYFTFLDKTEYSTLGKRVLGIKLTTINGKPLTLSKTFSRVCISIISILLLGLPLILRLQDRLTDTAVINRYE